MRLVWLSKSRRRPTASDVAETRRNRIRPIPVTSPTNTRRFVRAQVVKSHKFSDRKTRILIGPVDWGFFFFVFNSPKSSWISSTFELFSIDPKYKVSFCIFLHFVSFFFYMCTAYVCILRFFIAHRWVSNTYFRIFCHFSTCTAYFCVLRFFIALQSNSPTYFISICFILSQWSVRNLFYII